MKKSKLLSVLTAGAVIATTVGTYAAWDKLDANTTSREVTFRNPVTVTVDNDFQLSTASAKLGDLPTATSSVNFTVSNPGDLANQLTIVPTIVTNAPGVTIKDFDVEIVDTNNQDTPLQVTRDDDKDKYEFVDDSVKTTNYTVKLTPKDTSVTKVAGQAVSLKLTAKLSAEAPAASSK